MLHKFGNHACDQCRARRGRCDRRLPTCTFCIDNKLACTKNRKFTYQSSVTYQNVSTFSLSLTSDCSKEIKKRNIRKSNPKAKSDYPDILRRLMSDISASTSLRANSDVKKWFESSYSRFIINYFIKLSGIPLATAAPRDIRFLSEILISRLCSLSLGKEMLLQVQHAPGDIPVLLQEATDAYFHYFNPFHLLFTRQGYDSHNRSWLLRLSVWRAGLQFLPASPLRRTVADYIDNLLLDLTRPSVIRISFDCLQSFLILSLAIVDSRVLRRISLFRNLLVGMIYALGIHIPASREMSPNHLLERALAYRLAISRDVRYVFTMGTAPQFSEEFSTFHTMPRKTVHIYTRRLMDLVDQYSASLSGINTIPDFGKDGPFEPIQGPMLLHRAVSASIDCCALISNSCLYENAVILQKMNTSYNSCIDDNQSSHRIYTTVMWSDRSLFRIFFTAINKLRILREQVRCRDLVYLYSIPQYSQPFCDLYTQTDIYSEPVCGSQSSLVIQAIDQTILFLSTQYLHSRLHVLGIGAHINPSNLSSPLTPYPNLKTATPIITSAIKSAMHLLSLLDRFGSAPFCYVKSAPLSKAYIVLTQYYHTYWYQTKSSNADNPFDVSLVLARKLLLSLLPCPITGFFARNSIIYFDAFLSHYKIILPGEQKA